MSIKRWIVIAVVVGIGLLLYAPTQAMDALVNFRDAAGQLLYDLGLRSG